MSQMGGHEVYRPHHRRASPVIEDRGSRPRPDRDALVRTIHFIIRFLQQSGRMRREGIGGGSGAWVSYEAEQAHTRPMPNMTDGTVHLGRTSESGTPLRSQPQQL